MKGRLGWECFPRHSRPNAPESPGDFASQHIPGYRASAHSWRAVFSGVFELPGLCERLCLAFFRMAAKPKKTARASVAGMWCLSIPPLRSTIARTPWDQKTPEKKHTPKKTERRRMHVREKVPRPALPAGLSPEPSSSESSSPKVRGRLGLPFLHRIRASAGEMRCARTRCEATSPAHPNMFPATAHSCPSFVQSRRTSRGVWAAFASKLAEESIKQIRPNPEKPDEPEEDAHQCGGMLKSMKRGKTQKHGFGQLTAEAMRTTIPCAFLWTGTFARTVFVGVFFRPGCGGCLPCSKIPRTTISPTGARGSHFCFRAVPEMLARPERPKRPDCEPGGTRRRED